jgi:hypothetical protein
MKTYELLDIIKQMKKNVDRISKEIPNTNTIDFSKFEQFISELDILIDEKKLQNIKTGSYFSRSMNPSSMSAAEYRKFYKHSTMTEEEIQSLTGRFTGLISFEFPVLELFPGDGRFTQYAVSAEPLYIADYYTENMQEVGKLFNEFFNEKRLFKFEIKDFELVGIPDQQLGLVYCYSYFFVKDMDFIVNWAAEVFKKLIPGGHFIFNFIPHDTVEGFRLAEDKYLPVVDHYELENKLTDIGYEIVKKHIDYGFCSTILVKKLGNLEEFKLTGGLAAVIDLK